MNSSQGKPGSGWPFPLGPSWHPSPLPLLEEHLFCVLGRHCAKRLTSGVSVTLPATRKWGLEAGALGFMDDTPEGQGELVPGPWLHQGEAQRRI